MTVKELAELAGVSPATVSLVLNGKKGVSENKRREILKLVDEHQYIHSKKKNVNKQDILFIKYTKNGCIVEENVGFISSVMDAIEAECKARRFNFSIMNSEKNLSHILKEIKFSYYYGIIILGTELREEDYSALEMIPIPYVIVDNSMPYFDCNCVYIDNKVNSYRAIEYFAKNGFTDIGYFHSNDKIQNFIEREQGVHDAINRYGLEMSEDNIFEVPPTMLGAFEWTSKYISSKRRIPRCIFVDNDTITIGVMKALKIAGYEIPRDVSVIGFDNIPFAQIYSPTISTMNVNKQLLGTTALELLLSIISDKDIHNMKIKIGGDLINRQSTL